MKKKIRLSAPGTRVPPKMFSQAVLYDDIVYVSGQLGRHPEDGHLDPDAESQIRQTFSSVKTILENAGSSLDNIISCQLFLADKEDLPVLNRVYEELFGDMEVPPARCCICCSPVVEGCLFEMTCSAYIDR